MKILHYVGALNIGGAETMIMNIYRNIDRKKYIFDFAVPGTDKGFYEDEILQLGGRVFHITKAEESIVRKHLDMYNIVKKGTYDIVHLHTQNAFLASLLAITVKLAGNGKVIVHCHSTMDWRADKMLQFHRLFRKVVNRLADERLTCSKAAAEWLFGTCKNVTVLPLPVICDKFRYADEIYHSLRKEHGVENNFIITHVGRMAEVKNHKFLLDIFQEIYRKEPNSVLYLIGDGDIRQSLEKKAEENGLKENIVFWGNISDVDKKMLMSDVFVLPSKYEGFPTVVLEAQAAGLPCYISDVVTKDMGLTDLITFLPLTLSPESWGNYILEEKGKKAHRNREIYNSIIREKYDISVTVRKITKIYDNLA